MRVEACIRYWWYTDTQEAVLRWGYGMVGFAVEFGSLYRVCIIYAVVG